MLQLPPLPALQVPGQVDAEGRCTPSLYDRIGGAAAVQAAVELFYSKVLADPSVSHYFNAMDMKAQHRKLVAFMTYVFGGPGEYTGRGLVQAHKRLGITGTQFDNVAGHLAATLKELQVPKGLADEALAIVAGAKGAVVTASG